MPALTGEWIAFVCLLLVLIGTGVAEILWLISSGGVGTGRAAAFVITTNLSGFAVGLGISLACFFLIFMMVMGPDGTGGHSPEWQFAAVTAFSLILPVLVFFSLKLLGLFGFRVRQGRAAWKFAAASTAVNLLVLSATAVIIFFGAGALVKWNS